MGEISTVASPEGGSPELAVLPLNWPCWLHTCRQGDRKVLGWALFYFLPLSFWEPPWCREYKKLHGSDIERSGLQLDAVWPHGGEPALAPRLGDCKKETCLLEGRNSPQNWGACSCAACLWPRWMLSRISARKQHPAVLLRPPDPQLSLSLLCPRQFPRKGSWGTGDFLMLTNVVHCRYNLLLKVIMAILYTFSWTIIREQWAFLQKFEFNNPKALLIYPSKLMQRIT